MYEVFMIQDSRLGHLIDHAEVSQFKAVLSIDSLYALRLFAEAIYRATSSFKTNDGLNGWNNVSWSSW